MAPPAYSLRELTAYFLKLGTIGFGGPVALVEYMPRDLVERRDWISSEDYRDGLALSQLAPGPLAAQLAIYIGFVHYGLLGATAAGLASYWGTGAVTGLEDVKRLCRFDPQDTIVALIYLGWPIGDVPVPQRPPADVHFIS